MNKAVLVIDMPNNCWECPCFMDNGWRCQCRLDMDEEVHDGRPDWCPLHQLPEKWEEKPYNSASRKDWQRGYNHAIDDICGVVNEQEAMNEYYAERLSRFD